MNWTHYDEPLMTGDEILEILRTTGAIVEGHFELPDGLHTAAVLRTVKATQFAPFNRKLCFEIVRHFLELDIHVVIAAGADAVPVAVEVGRQLEARAIFVVSCSDMPALHPGFELHEGERAIVVQGVLRHDTEIDGVEALVRKANARLIGIGSIIDARQSRRRYTVKDVAAIQLSPPVHPVDACPLCAAGTELMLPN
ncbi:MAG TPA: hypothetical protein VHI13_09730 [Candidatus Kapabacteria bacterium]|nr:hypothetical protein [Candidatus Kapabacteria bacterium]